MMHEIALTNAKVILADREIDGTVVFSEGRITRIEEGSSGLPTAQDMEGDYLLPGLVELHTDSLEGHLIPRPGVFWPTLSAVMAHDAQIASAGITTVLDALRIGRLLNDTYRLEILRDMVEQISEARANGQLRADHLLHLRCELAVEDVVEHFETFRKEPLLRLVSLMDHTPGQRQFINLEAFKVYFKDRYKKSDREVEEAIATQIEDHNRFAVSNRIKLSEICRDNGIRLASHDDATAAHVEEAVGLGFSISEFPTTMEAASAAQQHGLSTIAGAPNVVRGGSHSGNIAALDLAAKGVLDALSSDYVPSSLLHAAFVLHRDLDLAMPDVMAIVSRNPARMVGLEDRGEIAPNMRADLIRVRLHEGTPVVRCVWREGQRIA